MTGQPKAEASTNDFIEIRSQMFDSATNLAVFRGEVRAHDPEGDLNCGVLSVVFQGESNRLERVEAEQDVLLTQGTAQMTADKAVYTLGEGKEVVEFSGHAVWTDGQRQGSGERVVFDREQRTVRAEKRAYLKLPRASFVESSLLPVAPKDSLHATPGLTNALMEVFSDLMTIHLPPTNGPVQRIEAEGGVMILDPEQDGRALADRAVYEDSSGILELSGSPMIQAEGRLLTGKTIKVNRVTRVLTAAPEAYLKLPVQGLDSLGVLANVSPNLPPKTAMNTNQFLEVWSEEFDYATNVLRFTGLVRANFLEGDIPQGKLRCDSLTIHYGERLESLVAEKDVEIEQFAVPTDPRPVSRKVNCASLRAEFWPEGRLKRAVVEQGVSAEQEEIRPGQPRPVRSTLSCETVTASFSATTNRVERMIADKNVILAQGDRIGRGAQAVYTGLTGLMELTGQPTASMPEGEITEAERLIWDSVHERFVGKGRFKSQWVRPKRGTNELAVPTAKLR
jgi:lipopolysaccharide export system protein LptA